MKGIDLIGQQFGGLTVVEPVCYRPGGYVWKCVCECGQTIEAYGRNLRLGKSKSCGCRRARITAERMTRHGQARKGKITSEHRIWRAMLDRCGNPNCNSYKYYGARGIAVCQKWHEFEMFYADMGSRPSAKHSIDRIDVNGNYEPGNCRWATPMEQRHNRRDSVPKALP